MLYLGPAIFLVYVAFSLFYEVPLSGLVAHLRPSLSSSTADEENYRTFEIPTPETHHELVSLSTPDGKYFRVDFGPGKEGAINPNIIPHPTLDNVWIMVAQEKATLTENFYELGCLASFTNTSVLRCNEPAVRLPYEPTRNLQKGICKGKFNMLEINNGPHDARVFHGPDSLYTIYGSNSAHTCFGQFIQTFPPLMMQGGVEQVPKGQFWQGTEMQRPKPYGTVEKNWFVFWDDKNRIHAHYDIVPRRVFSRLGADGSAGENLAVTAGRRDQRCLNRYMPPTTHRDESIHQATNSLSVTMCNRTDPSCLPSEKNTFVFTLFHKKTFLDYHSVYEPYAMVFSPREPYELYGIGQKPLWVRGRRKREKDGHTEMFYVVSMSWKSKTQKYHGYLDDPIVLALGYEDEDTAGIDVRAVDVLRDLGLCGKIKDDGLAGELENGSKDTLH